MNGHALAGTMWPAKMWHSFIQRIPGPWVGREQSPVQSWDHCWYNGLRFKVSYVKLFKNGPFLPQFKRIQTSKKGLALSHKRRNRNVKSRVGFPIAPLACVVKYNYQNNFVNFIQMKIEWWTFGIMLDIQYGESSCAFILCQNSPAESQKVICKKV